MFPTSRRVLESPRRRTLAFFAVLLNLLAGIAAAPRVATAATCSPTATALCLASQRFRVEVSWRDFQGNTGVGRAVALSGDTGYFWFFDDKNVELVLKVLDGRGLNGHFWVFYGALSSVRYEITVTDTVSGQRKSYINPAGKLGSVADTTAFTVAAGARAAAASPVEPAGQVEIARTVEAALVELDAAAGAACSPTATSLCLNQGRFRAEVSWRDFQGNTGKGQAIALTADTGYFWFFDAANVELVVKILDGRGLNQYFWVFYGALSTVEYQLTVTDTVSGRTTHYFNRPGNLASIADTAALGDGAYVQAVADASRAVSERIPTTGGTLAANGADGSVFTLDIPAGALLSAQDVTLTPLSSIQGLPLSGGLAAAVQIEPEGLLLYEAATLTLEPAAAVARAQEITFSVQGAGAEFFLNPPLPVAGAIRVPVLHFSGYGVGRGTQADLDAQALRLPTLAVDRLAQKVAARVLPQVRSGAFGASAALVEAPRTAAAATSCGPGLAADFLADYRGNIVSLLPEVVSDCEKLRWRTPQLRGFIELAQIMGCSNELSREIGTIREFLLSGQVRCYNEAFTKCVSNRDPAQVAEIVRWRQELIRDGNAGKVDPGKLERCVRFELAFESTIGSRSDPLPEGVQWGSESHLRTQRDIPIRFSEVDGFKGSGQLAYLSAKFTGSAEHSCTITLTPKAGSKFTITDLHFRIAPSLGYVPITPPTLRLDYDTGAPSETVRKVCTDPEEDTSGPFRYWEGGYHIGHFDEEDDESLSPFAYSADLEVLGLHGQYAIKQYQYSVTFSSEPPYSPYRHLSEDSGFTLFHTPE